MAYSELIKDFSKIRDYMNQFYVYGFKSRTEYGEKSARSYDNERRRIESWLGDYMSFNQDSTGKNVFISVDSRAILHNPLYNAFKAKSFTDNDIMLHFYILDILADGDSASVNEITNIISEEYSSFFENPKELDASTIRKKLKEYEKLGILKSSKNGKELVFSRNEDSVDLESFKDAIAFFSEEAPLGVVGSFILDKYSSIPNYYTFKHHYILHATESEILYDLLLAINEKRKITITNFSNRMNKANTNNIVPLKIYASTQGGRRYVLVFHLKYKRMMFYRLDSIKKIDFGEACEDFDKLLKNASRFEKHLWGVATTSKHVIEHIEMTIFVDEKENYIVDRLYREKRNGIVNKVDSNHYKFIADVFDSSELLPWIRTFTGRITKLECSNQTTVDTFYSDLDEMKRMYGGDYNAV